MSLPTPNYILDGDFYLDTPSNGGLWSMAPDTITLESGTFVRPIYIDYVPKQVKEDKRWNHLDMSKYHYCYTPKGILPIPKDKIIQV